MVRWRSGRSGRRPPARWSESARRASRSAGRSTFVAGGGELDGERKPVEPTQISATVAALSGVERERGDAGPAAGDEHRDGVVALELGPAAARQVGQRQRADLHLVLARSRAGRCGWWRARSGAGTRRGGPRRPARRRRSARGCRAPGATAAHRAVRRSPPTARRPASRGTPERPSHRRQQLVGRLRRSKLHEGDATGERLDHLLGAPRPRAGSCRRRPDRGA